MADTHAQLSRSTTASRRSTSVSAPTRACPALDRPADAQRFRYSAGSLAAYMLTSDDFEALARTYGRVGGMDRMATLVKAIRAERGAERVLLLDGGDALQGSYTALATKGADMVARAASRSGVEATTGHWEFTLGAERESPSCSAASIAKGSSGIALPRRQRARHRLRRARVRLHRACSSGAASRVAVIGQAFPYTPIANPRWMMPNWSFGIREATLRQVAWRMRARGGAEVVVLLSHNGFDVDRKLAARVEGIDVILTAPHPRCAAAADARSATRCWSPRARTASSCRASTWRWTDGRVARFLPTR